MATDDDKETNGKMEEWMYEFAWKGYNEALEHIKIVDNKAMSVINFSSILIPIITAVLYYITNIKIYPEVTQLFLISSVILLLGSIFLAFRVLMPQNHGMIRVQNHFKKIDDVIDEMDDNSDKYMEILGSTAQDIADWQNTLMTARDNKIKYFKYSSYVFVGALSFIFLSTMGIIYPWIREMIISLIGL